MLLLAASALMAGTGLAYAASGAGIVLLLVAFVGTINPSGGSTSIFVPIEHTVLTAAVPAHERTHAFARYSLASAASPALAGALFAAGYAIWPLLLCGVLKIGYDLMLLAAFRHIRPPEERG